MTWLAAVVVAALADGGVPEQLTPAAQRIADTRPTDFVWSKLEDGVYQRFGTEKDGPLHLWRPSAYRPASASLVVYFHGFFTDSDGALREHRLITQFRDSGRNALFVVLETRSWRTDPMPFETLDSLWKKLESLGVPLPKGPVVLLGHSGAYKHLAQWLEDERITRVLLVDGLYANEPELAAWVKRDGKQLVLVGFETQQRQDWFVAKHQAVVLPTLPYLYDALPPKARAAKVVAIHSERFDHMGLVESGRVLPWLLRSF